MNLGGDCVGVIAGGGGAEALAAERRQLGLQNGGEFVLDETLFHLAAGGHDAEFLAFQRQKPQNGRIARQRFGLRHLFLFDDQRNDAGAAQLVAFVHHEPAGPGGDHQLAHGVQRPQPGQVHQKQPVRVGGQLDFALLGLAGPHVFVPADVPQNFRRLVFVEHGVVVLPDVKMLLAHRQQHRDVLRLDDVSLAEHRAFTFAGDDLGDIVAQHLSHGVLSFHQFHGFTTFPVSIIVRAACAVQ